MMYLGEPRPAIGPALDDVLAWLECQSRYLPSNPSLSRQAVDRLLGKHGDVRKVLRVNSMAQALYVAFLCGEPLDGIVASLVGVLRLPNAQLPIVAELLHVVELAARDTPSSCSRRRRLLQDVQAVKAALFDRVCAVGSDRALTHEQRRVVGIDPRCNQLFRVIAFAGSGKTTTVHSAARRWLRDAPSLRILYLAFNKEAVSDARRRFASTTVDCRTIHSLALRGVGLGPSGRQALEQCQRLGIKGYLQPPRSWKVDFRTGKAANRIVARFLTSDARDFPARDDDDDGAAYDLAVRLWRAAQAGRIAITHDVYLKVYQLGRPDLKTTFDVVIVDESQDCNAAMKGIILEQDVTRLLIGDVYQHIYGFRGCYNLLREAPADSTLTLSRSFRFGSAIAEVCNIILGVLRAHEADASQATITGSTCADQVQSEAFRGRHAVIARSNANVWLTALRAHFVERKKVHIVGGINNDAGSLFTLYYEVAMMMSGRAFKPTHQSLKNLTRKTLIRTTDKGDDEDLSRARWFHDDACHEFPDLPQRMADLRAAVVPDGEQADVIVSNVHQAKGMEFDDVDLVDDFIDIAALEQGRKRDCPKEVVREELCLLYVAVSRCRRRLRLRPGHDLRQYLWSSSGNVGRQRLTVVRMSERDGSPPSCASCPQSDNDAGPFGARARERNRDQYRDYPAAGLRLLVSADEQAVVCDKHTYLPLVDRRSSASPSSSPPTKRLRQAPESARCTTSSST
ncbi:hypothetical protein PBRA_008925 [Plasmodiophora brassicae]|uniref:UvrD-like helicase C-terminal domain-containing protein n=1 Tax=Plasmodiophora brassicae TaxID=37360 RepID=A0A0G4J4X9_PLABS|nr:hypothetical protein PBRA_008925 [Plasmodiophora brassicae]